MAAVAPKPASVKEAWQEPTMTSEIRIADFNFDINGDGDLDPFEKKVMAAFKAADRDNSGTLTPVEMLEIMRGMAEQHKTAKRLGRTVFGLAGLVVLLILALVGVSVSGAMVGGEVIKESKVPDCSDPAEADSARCNPSGLVSVGVVESFVESIYDLPKVPTNQLAYLKDVAMYVDMSSNAAIGGPVEATFKLASAYKRSDTHAYLRTQDGSTIELDAVARTGTITIDGVSYPVSAEAPASSAGRKLETAPDAPMAPTLTARQLANRHTEKNRRQLGFNGALMTSGSFTMMAGGGYGRRRQLGFHGALMTSGSFTMMASAGYS